MITNILLLIAILFGFGVVFFIATDKHIQDKKHRNINNTETDE